MNFINKKALLALAVLSFGSTAFGYKFTFNNKTNKRVMVEMVLQGDIPMGREYWKLLNPGQSYTFPFTAGASEGRKIGFCWKSIKLLAYDQKDAAAYATRKSGDPKERTLLGNLTMDYDFYTNKSRVIYDYFANQAVWHVPTIFYTKSDFDTSKIVDAMQAIGNSSEKIADLAAKAASEGAAPKIDFGLGKLLSSMTGLIAEGMAKGACADRTFDIFALDIPIPGTKPEKRESAFVLISRVN